MEDERDIADGKPSLYDDVLTGDNSPTGELADPEEAPPQRSPNCVRRPINALEATLFTAPADEKEEGPPRSRQGDSKATAKEAVKE